jgi:hypothetical protein
VPNSVWKTPLVTVVRYETIGLSSRQRHVVESPLSVWDTSVPLPITVSPFGTVTVKSQVAKSFRLSFTGIHVGAPCGSLTTYAPSSVGIQPSFDLSGSRT